MLMMNGRRSFLPQSDLSQSLASVLTLVLEFRSLLVLVKVAIGVDDGVLLLKLIGTFPADAVCLVRKGPNAYISGGGGSSAHEFKDP